MSDNKIAVSVAVPLFNEEESVPVLFERLKLSLDTLSVPYEIIFVDDGSSDATFEVARNIAASNPCLRVIKFRRNFGQTPAMAAGIDYSRGDIIVTMDGDLQNDPKDIPKFIEEIEAGYDIVVGWRHNRKDKLISRKIPSMIANWLIGTATDVPIKDNGCSLKAYRATVIKNVALYSEMHRFIPAMANISGTRISQIKVRHHARQFGESKYGLSRIYKVLIDLAGILAIRAAVFAPLRWFVRLAAPFLFFGLALLLISINDYPSISLIFVGTGFAFFVQGLSLILSGTLVELILRSDNLGLRLLIGATSRND